MLFESLQADVTALCETVTTFKHLIRVSESKFSSLWSHVFIIRVSVYKMNIFYL